MCKAVSGKEYFYICISESGTVFTLVFAYS